ncbi:F1F0 ATP synthase subunit 5 [Sugiyamaella lignohabitans]|uniref:ATP synthase subunit 5, mitochondrial n=1 Tax=Sugiyamaella lignohabitans TaxID=796027 RepID=A0A161HLY7_9ASCO|nr:F1F0 ATP synthase subunit 5 [Sugiyamaella lignohabitans]ANB14537.1 F1F0 ATP synthase subunit 5 [Sugiyamaella lignohabitans]
MFVRALRQPMALRAIARTYATKASTAPPVQLFGIDGSYASALYTASAKDSTIEATEKGLTSLKSLISEDAKLATIIANPALSASDKKTVVEAISQSAGLDKTVSNFLSVLADNNRLSLLPEVITKFEVLSNAHQGFVDATVTSASPLDDKTLGRLKAAISQSEFVGEGKKLRITNDVKSEILGGLVVEIGDRTVDLSVSAKIARLNKLLTDSV